MLKNLVFSLVVTTLLAACGGGTEAPTNNPPALAITAQPSDVSVVAPNTATFNVTATGAGLGYQWQGNTGAGSAFSNIAGATSSSFTTPATSTADTGKQFRVVVSGSGSSITSSAVTLTVTSAVIAPVITMQPTSQRATAPAPASFSVTATGTALTYQWQRCTDSLEVCVAWVDIGGATAATYVTGATSTTMDGQRFRVIVRNSAGNVASASATLSVDPTPVAPTITQQPVNVTVTAPNAAVFTVAYTGVPEPLPNWQYSNNGTTWFNLGEFGATLTISPTSLSDNGRRYRAQINGVAGTVVSNVVTLTVNAAAVLPSFTTQPQSVTVTAGQNAQLSVAVSGSPTPTLQWQLSTDNGASWSNINGATSNVFDIIAPSIANNGRQFRVVASNSAGSVNSDAATLIVNAAVRTWQRANLIETDNAGNADNAQVAMDGSGNAIAVWTQFDGVSTNIWTNRYVAGSGWSASASRLKTDANESILPQIGFDSAGNAIAVWLQNTGGNFTVWSSRNVGGVWGAASNIGVNLGSANAFSLAVAANGNAVVVWTQTDGQPPVGFVNHVDVWSNTFTPSGGWGIASLLESAPDNVTSNAQVAIDANGNAMAVWNQNDPGGFLSNLWARPYAAGSGWGNAQVIDINAGSMRLAMDANGNGTLVYLKNGASFVNVIANAFSSGGSFGTPFTLDANTGNTQAPQIAMNASGAAVAVWYQVGGSNPGIISASKPASGTWSVATRIDTATGFAQSPAAAIDSAGNAFVTWGQDIGTVSRIFASRLPVGGSWTTPQQLQVGSQAGYLPQIAVDANGNATAVWTGDGTTLTNISAAVYR